MVTGEAEPDPRQGIWLPRIGPKVVAANKLACQSSILAVSHSHTDILSFSPAVALHLLQAKTCTTELFCNRQKHPSSSTTHYIQGHRESRAKRQETTQDDTPKHHRAHSHQSAACFGLWEGGTRVPREKPTITQGKHVNPQSQSRDLNPDSQAITQRC